MLADPGIITHRELIETIKMVDKLGRLGCEYGENLITLLCLIKGFSLGLDQVFSIPSASISSQPIMPRN
jgi:hypothetical protein